MPIKPTDQPADDEREGASKPAGEESPAAEDVADPAGDDSPFEIGPVHQQDQDPAFTPDRRAHISFFGEVSGKVREAGASVRYAATTIFHGLLQRGTSQEAEPAPAMQRRGISLEGDQSEPQKEKKYVTGTFNQKLGLDLRNFLKTPERDREGIRVFRKSPLYQYLDELSISEFGKDFRAEYENFQIGESRQRIINFLNRFSDRLNKVSARNVEPPLEYHPNSVHANISRAIADLVAEHPSAMATIITELLKMFTKVRNDLELYQQVPTARTQIHNYLITQYIGVLREAASSIPRLDKSDIISLDHNRRMTLTEISQKFHELADQEEKRHFPPLEDKDQSFS